jgi:cyclophilin family peptidyl-prolyl cis-trans isomerase/HEAT repeat protein
MKKTISFALVLLLSPGICSCGRRPLRAVEIERNRLFTEILYRQDHRSLGEDDFFPSHLLDSSQPQVQEWCALGLGRIGDPRALPWLYEALGARQASVRAAAAFAVGEIEDRDLLRGEGRESDARASAVLRSMLEDPALTVSMRATEALGKIGTEADASAIAGRIDRVRYDGSPGQHAYLSLAITALMRLKGVAARPALERLAGFDDPELQWRAVNALYRLRAKESQPLFERLLQSRDPDVRAHAARALGVCGDPRLAGELEPMLRPVQDGKRNSLSVRVGALQALTALGNPASAAAILGALPAAPLGESSPDEIDQTNFAVQALAALGKIGSWKDAGSLQPFVRAGGPVAASALVALARLLRQDPDRFFGMTAGTKWETPAGMRAWAAAMGELGGPRALSELRGMLVRAAEDDAPASIRMAIPAVLQALSKARDPDMQEVIPTYLASQDGVVLRAALEAYQPAAGAAAPWRPLIRAYPGPGIAEDPQARIAILNHLEPWLAASEIQSFLRTAASDPERNVRIAARRLLRQAHVEDVPEGPESEKAGASRLTCELLAGSRRDRTIAILETTRGNIEIELYRQDAPLTVANFVSLAQQGFFDGHTFMRVVPYFVIQGGDPRDDQEGGPGYTIRCEINMRPFERGSVGMALSGKDTGGSQFFITLSPQPHLDGGYTCFGRVISGMAAAEHMLAGDPITRVRIKEEVTLLDYRDY